MTRLRTFLATAMLCLAGTASADVEGKLNLPVLGVIPQDDAVLQASNVGMPIILDPESRAGHAYDDAVGRLLGETLELRFTTPPKRTFMNWLLRRTA